MNPWISRACTKEPLKFKIKCDSLEVVNLLIEIPNVAPVFRSVCIKEDDYFIMEVAFKRE